MLHSYAMLTRVLTVMTPSARGLPTNITGKPEQEHPYSIFVAIGPSKSISISKNTITHDCLIRNNY